MKKGTFGYIFFATLPKLYSQLNICIIKRYGKSALNQCKKKFVATIAFFKNKPYICSQKTTNNYETSTHPDCVPCRNVYG